MSYADILASALGKPNTPVQTPGSAPKTLDAPEALQALWRDHGFASYHSGFYWTTDPERFSAITQLWPRLKQPAMVFGRDAFANLYFTSAGRVRQLNPHRNEIVVVASDLDLFFPACVADVDFRVDYMWEDLFNTARPLHGTLEYDECYGFFPALALGGSLDASNLRRVKMDEHLQLLSQM